MANQAVGSAVWAGDQVEYQRMLKEIAPMYELRPSNKPAMPDPLPPWVWEEDHSSHRRHFSMLGQLWVRLANYYRDTPPVLNTALTLSEAKFAIGKCSIVLAFKGERETGEEAACVVVCVGARPTILYDDPNLFPSDGLIAAIYTLKD